MNSTALSESSNPIKSWQLLLFVIVAGIFFVAQIWVTHRYFTTVLPGGNDFYPRWYGSQQLLLEGRNPYDETVTREIEAVLDPLNQRTNSFNFAFPLNVSLTFLPLVILDYAWAQAIWIVVIIWLSGAMMLMLRQLLGWRTTPLSVLAILISTLTFYPVVRTIFLGQFTIHVTFFVVLGLLLRQRGHLLWAGVVLSLTIIKPQMMVLLLPWFVIWFFYQREWAILKGLVFGGLSQLIVTLVLLPSWPLDFLHGLGEYADRAGGRNLLEIVFGWLPAAILSPTVTLLSLLLLLLFCYQVRKPVLASLQRVEPVRSEHLFWQGTSWAIIVTALVPFQTGTTNQVLLLVPFVLWGSLLAARNKGVLFWVGFVGASVLLWVLFQVTLRGAAESELMFLPLPLLAFAGLLYWQWRTFRLAQAQ